ncbi:PREDICTED: zeatin O-glucosyltransferase-like [Nelumbo nucifera]|uniref:Glycosyltransferase n=2 Tax=Nelumbo nucifera TaxID=4432 RepID=A0A822YEC5_NELNU|nr:PREDICTED: zeatin O-glucosyltransferase-like [Nelumbo nucifera]DAD29599.1 TPA_asm: hypothetical protein HUJ06_031067 [Nelumbo nucifera]
MDSPRAYKDPNYKHQICRAEANKNNSNYPFIDRSMDHHDVFHLSYPRRLHPHRHFADQNGFKQAPVMVVTVPFPAQGHLNQLLHLSRLISAYGIPVHYVASATHNRQAKHRVHGWDPLSTPNLHFHDFPLPPFLNPPPNPHAPIKFPAHLQPTFDASLHLREPLAQLLDSLSAIAYRVVVIHDTLMAYAVQDVVALPNAEAYAFHPVSAFAIVFHLWESLGRPTDEGILIPNDVPHHSLEGCFTGEFAKFIARQYDLMNFDVGDLYNTCRAMEGRFVDLLDQEKLSGNKRIWAVGPLNPVVLGAARESPWRRHKCLEWLDKQPLRSVLYVSFGTMTSLSDDQIFELAVGLERSKQRFIWVLREADRGDIYAEEEEARVTQLPKGYEERVEGVGLIVRDWAPQLEILAHRATGGFLSHCGWNSCVESISMGVPIAAWPMHSDQPRNTMLVTQVLRVGLVVREWARRHELVSSDAVEDAARKLMASEEGDDMRKKAEMLGGAVRDSMSEGGISRAELDSFVAHISRV